MAITVERRGYQYAIELDGALAGWVREVSGGDATADVITEKIGLDRVVRKHIGSARYDMTNAAGEDAIDGIKVDIKGNLYVSGPGGLWVLSPTGKHLGTIKASPATRYQFVMIA